MTCYLITPRFIKRMLHNRRAQCGVAYIFNIGYQLLLRDHHRCSGITLAVRPSLGSSAFLQTLLKRRTKNETGHSQL